MCRVRLKWRPGGRAARTRPASWDGAAPGRTRARTRPTSPRCLTGAPRVSRADLGATGDGAHRRWPGGEEAGRVGGSAGTSGRTLRPSSWTGQDLRRGEACNRSGLTPSGAVVDQRGLAIHAHAACLRFRPSPVDHYHDVAEKQGACVTVGVPARGTGRPLVSGKEGALSCHAGVCTTGTWYSAAAYPQAPSGGREMTGECPHAEPPGSPQPKARPCSSPPSRATRRCDSGACDALGRLIKPVFN